MLFITCVLSLIFSIIIYFVIESLNLPILMILFFLNGFFMISINSISYEFGVELTYPIEASISNGALNSLSNIFSLIFILFCSFIIDLA